MRSPRQRLLVLRRSIIAASQPYAEVGHSENVLLYEQTAALSNRAIHRSIPDTPPNIEIDNPQAILDAIDQVLDMH